MTLAFDTSEDGRWIDCFFDRAREGGFGYVVTPNVDHLVNLLNGSVERASYIDAEFIINDSRILELLAQMVGKSLPATPGSDLVAAMLNHPRASEFKIAVVGPNAIEFNQLVKRFPCLTLDLVPSSDRLVRGMPDWDNLVARLVDLPFDILLVCISFPKQEYLSHDLAKAGRSKGLAICAGASVDFLTGKQTRAPLIFQRLRLEWAFRLASNPRRLWRRYILKGPKVLFHFLRYEIFSTKTIE